MGRLIYLASGGTPAPQVSLGGGRTLLSGANAATTTWSAAAGSGFTPATGDALVRVFYRANGTSTLPITVSIGGVAVAQRVSADGGNASEAGVWIGTVRGLPTGAALDVVLASAGGSTNPVGKLVLRCADIHDWGGAVGLVTTPTVVQGSANVKQVSVSGTAASATSLLAGVAGVVDAGCTPLSVAGWDVGAEATVGSTAGASSDAAFVSRGSPGAAVAATLAASSAVAWTDWAAAFIELL